MPRRDAGLRRDARKGQDSVVSTLPIEVVARAGQLLGMSPARFLRDYWQKRPLLIRAAFPHFEAPLTPEDLAGLACEEAALSRLIRYHREQDRWDVRTGPFAESEFPGLPREDWTLLVQDVDKWDADVAALLPAFAFLPRWRIDDIMVSFAAPGGSVGAHVDQYDVFLLQGRGRRRWEIDASPAPSTEFRDDVELKLLREFHPTHAWTLEPGDMLYLPPGVPHHGVALDACLTLSVGMRAPSQAELLVDFAEHLAGQWPETQRYADPDLAPVKHDGEIDADALARVAAALPWVRLDGDDAGSRQEELRRWFGAFITRYRSAGEVVAPPKAPTPAQVAARLQAGSQLVRHPFARFAWARAGRGAELFADGQRHAASLGAARRLCADAALGADDLAAMSAADRALVHDLVVRGALVLSRPARRRA
jgi:50S ribosomal protein L16 3-hydroxylase